MKYILLCGGNGSRYYNYSLPKPLNYIYGKHMIEFTIENIPSNNIFIIYNILLDNYNFKEIIVNKFKNKIFNFASIDYLTRGPVETAYIGIKKFKDLLQDDNILFIDNDNLHYLDNIKQLDYLNNDFIGYSIDKSNKSNYSFIKINSDNNIIDIIEKTKISDLFCCGLYGFKNTNHFVKYAKEVIDNNYKINNEFYFSQLYKYILNSDNIIQSIFIESTQHIGSFSEISNNQYNINIPKLRICFDLDNTLVTPPTIINDYSTVNPINKNIELLKMFKNQGHEIIIYTARRMTTHKGNVGKVIKDIALVTINTLENLNIEYDELIFGKPIADIYIDDKAINPYVNNLSYFGFFTNYEQYLPNKIDTNKYNNIKFIDNKIIKTGPTKFICGELYYYQNIPNEICVYFPKLLNYDDSLIDKITIELEYIKGIPLFYLYKNELITKKILDQLFIILKVLHEQNNKNTFEITDINIKNNYFEKIKKRFENKIDYPFEDADIIYENIITYLTLNYSPKKVDIIHGDFWFSNIIMTYDDNIKLIDMKGQVDNILNIGGDIYYDYGKLYQSIIGYDLILNGYQINDDYINFMKNLFIIKCNEEGLNFEYLKYVTKSLIFGSFHFIDKTIDIKNKIWNLIKSIN